MLHFVKPFEVDEPFEYALKKIQDGPAHEPGYQDDCKCSRS